MKLSAVFDVFSKRDKEADVFTYEVPTVLRNKILMYCRDVFSNSRGIDGGRSCINEFWNEVHQALQYRHGKPQLVEGYYSRSKAEDAVSFLLDCHDEEFLDFVEYIFKVECLFHVPLEENDLVREINALFISEGVGYELTEMVKETVVEPVDWYPFFGQEMETIKVVSYPKVISKDTQAVHTLTVKPALKLLTQGKFQAANEEYLEAFEDYRNGDYRNCLTKCGSAFESVMKVICDEKKWPYEQTDTAGQLIRTIIANTNLDSYFEQPLIIIATLRNRLSKSHGSGTLSKDVPQHLARFALNVTASAILLLVDETRQRCTT